MKIYKITEASEYLGVSINTLKTLANNGKVKSFKTSGEHRRFRHPCPRPIDTMRAIVHLAAPEGGLIIDPFAGSGSTLLAAKQTNRRAIGIEIEERYCEIAARRLAQGVMPWE